jgi:hypothetical protein
MSGNSLGATFTLGFIKVVTPGNAVPISTNVSVNTGSAPGSSVAVPVTSNEILVSAPSSNTGDVFLCFGAGNSKTTPANGSGVVFCVPKGTTMRLACQGATSPYQLALYSIDALNANDGAYVSAINI